MRYQSNRRNFFPRLTTAITLAVFATAGCLGSGAGVEADDTAASKKEEPPAECGGFGKLSAESGRCECDSGYDLDLRNVTNCVPASQTCGGHGHLVTDSSQNLSCVCDPGYQIDPASIFTCVQPTWECVTFPEYPWAVPIGLYLNTENNAPPHDMTMGIYADDWSRPHSMLRLEVWHGFGENGSIAFPAHRSFYVGYKPADCDLCLFLGQGCDDYGCETLFFAQGGSLTVSQADRNTNTGRLVATGTNLKLVEWNPESSAETPILGGKCIQISRLEMEVSWGISGSCSGDSCNAGYGDGQCCSDAPYCTNGTGSTYNRYCSTYCGTTGEGCAGPENCCSGYTCFLGSCVSDTCGGNACSAGYNNGGCCTAAPYCHGDSPQCRTYCGDAGTQCTSDFDCCTPAVCSGGVCG